MFKAIKTLRRHRNSASAQNRHESSADGLIRRLGCAILFVLVAVALLVVVDQAVVQPLLIRLDRFAPVINLSGRQRMLSQKLTKSALKFGAWYHRTRSDCFETRACRQTLKQWTAAHVALQEGDSNLGIEQISSPEIQRQWNLIDPHFDAMATAAEKLIDADKRAIQSAAVETIVSTNRSFSPPWTRSSS